MKKNTAIAASIIVLVSILLWVALKSEEPLPDGRIGLGFIGFTNLASTPHGLFWFTNKGARVVWDHEVSHLSTNGWFVESWGRRIPIPRADGPEAGDLYLVAIPLGKTNGDVRIRVNCTEFAQSRLGRFLESMSEKYEGHVNNRSVTHPFGRSFRVINEFHFEETSKEP